MDKLRHENLPENADAYLVKVMPSSQTYTSHLHRFIFEIQYGTMKDETFLPIGKPVRYQSETLPMI
jgi:hypothetical protein